MPFQNETEINGYLAHFGVDKSALSFVYIEPTENIRKNRGFDAIGVNSRGWKIQLLTITNEDSHDDLTALLPILGEEITNRLRDLKNRFEEAKKSGIKNPMLSPEDICEIIQSVAGPLPDELKTSVNQAVEPSYNALKEQLSAKSKE